MKNFLFLIFTGVYFYLFCQVIDFLFRNSGLNILLDILVIVCWIAALVASVGLSDYTVKKIEAYFQK
ncbi:MAG: hypothetical protein IKA16_02490 [Oscillospiraceae bacterium]|nr:hypothetical protein [Oscillospiraceae bacterium]